jgi:hypothetical protein
VERLNKVVETRKFDFHEYMMAKDLIRRIKNGEDLVGNPAASPPVNDPAESQ